jgi:phenylacetate-coenzyme A ligase PaaK-like adenylate-forming protein
MSKIFFNEEIECISLKNLVLLQETNLRTSELIKYAKTSALYLDIWQKIGFTPFTIDYRNQIMNFPYINSADIKQAYTQHEISEVVNLEYARLWSCTSGTTGAGKWIPYSDDDIELFENILMRNFYLRGNLGKTHRVLAFTSPAPFVADMITNLGVMAQAKYGRQQEIIPIGLSVSPDIIKLARSRNVESLISFPSVAVKVAESITGNVKEQLESVLHGKKTFKTVLLRFILAIKKPSVRSVFKLRYGLFSGEAVDPYRSVLKKQFGLESFETYAFTEFPSLNMDCEYHDGIHIWSDCCIPEIIPERELEKEDNIPGYKPQAIFLDEAPEGTMGEYVVTTFNRALPLIRYRTSDYIRVVSTAPCKCGRTHPRIKIIRRLDDVINMGLIRFPLTDIETALSQVNRYGSINQWQINLTRQDYKPLMKLIVTGIDISDSQAFIDDIKEHLFDIKILKAGAEGKLICMPEIHLETSVNIITTATGKIKRIVYDSNW